MAEMFPLLVVDARLPHTSKIAYPADQTRQSVSGGCNVGCVLQSCFEVADANDIRLPVSIASCHRCPDFSPHGRC